MDLIALSPQVKDQCRENPKIPQDILAEIATCCRFMTSLLKKFLRGYEVVLVLERNEWKNMKVM